MGRSPPIVGTSAEVDMGSKKADSVDSGVGSSIPPAGAGSNLAGDTIKSLPPQGIRDLLHLRSVCFGHPSRRHPEPMDAAWPEGRDRRSVGGER